MSSIDDKTVTHVAKLARIAIEPQDIQNVRTHLTNVLKLIEQMEQVDTSNAIAIAHPIEDMYQRLREDVVTKTNQREDILQNAPLTESGLYLVNAVLETE
jgi:aspartyl-tRNA(Asn)/glutamyl-tRNA(Gln) amidotransferase subunit C